MPSQRKSSKKAATVSMKVASNKKRSKETTTSLLLNDEQSSSASNNKMLKFHDVTSKVHKSATSSFTTGDDKKSYTRQKIQLSKEDIERYSNVCSQTLAAKLLNVSLSTLKRRFYELGMGRWPKVRNQGEDCKRTIYYLLNDEDKNTKFIDSLTMQNLQQAFEGIFATTADAQEQQQPQDDMAIVADNQQQLPVSSTSGNSVSGASSPASTSEAEMSNEGSEL